jgi:hypothetical protein
MWVGDIVRSARDVLQDNDAATYRYSDDSMIRAINMAVFDLRRARPDYFIGTYATPIRFATMLEEDVPLPDELFPSFVKYVAGWCEMRDDEYTADGRAVALTKMFYSDIGAI